MKQEQNDRLGAGDCQPIETQQPPEIVGQIDNPVLEAARRLWWRAFDRLCGFFVLMRLWIFDGIDESEPPTPVDLQR